MLGAFLASGSTTVRLAGLLAGWLAWLPEACAHRSAVWRRIGRGEASCAGGARVELAINISAHPLKLAYWRESVTAVLDLDLHVDLVHRRIT